MKNNKVFSVILTLVMLSLLVMGCGGSNESNNGKKVEEGVVVESSPTNPAESSPEDKGYLVSDSPLDMTIHMHYYNTTAFDDNWEVFKKAAELTNVKLKGTAAKTATNSEEIFNLMLTNGQLSDIVVSTKPKFHQYGVEGAFIPLMDLIKEHAPNLNSYLSENPNVIQSIKAPDDQVYFIPFMPDGAAAQGWFIRKDWLDALKLEVPETIDEYYEMLTAFKNMNPNGDDAKQEIPYFNRNGNVLDLVAFWGARSDWTVIDNKATWGPAQPEFKTAMSNIAKWYKEGLIDQEIFTRGGKSREILLGDNVGGSTHDWFSSTAIYNDSVKAQVPGIEFIPIAPPKDVNGNQVELSSRDAVAQSGWGISADNKNPIETIKFFDFWFTEEGKRLANFGVEGVTYDLVDGKPIFKDEVLNSGGSVLSKLNEYGAQLEFGFKQDFEYEKQWMNDIALQGAEMYIQNNYFAKKFPMVTFTLEEQKRLDQIRSAITTFYLESVQKWVLGAEDVDASFDKYLNTLKSMGIDELTQIYQSAYDRYIQ